MDKDQYWNIVKGLGILAVVLGHSGSPVTPYVYMYHLALFFFISGYLYKESYSTDPFVYFAGRLRRLWLPMIQYGVAFALLHNLFLRMHIYSEQTLPSILPTKYFGKLDLFCSIKGTLLMQGGMEPMGGAMWFLLPLLLGMTLFCTIRHFTTRTVQPYGEIMAASLVLVLYILGVAIIRKRINIDYHGDIAMVAMPIIYLGFLTAKYRNRVPIKWYLGLASLVAVIAVYKITGTYVSLSEKQIIGPKWFLLASLGGIYFNLVLARVIQMSKTLSYLIAYAGERSFHIMALHFLMFKIVSLCYVLAYSKPLFWIAKFPIIDSRWWIAYTIAGVLGPVACVDLFAFVKTKWTGFRETERPSAAFG